MALVVVQHRHAQVVDRVRGEGGEVLPQGGRVLGRGVEVGVGFEVLGHRGGALWGIGFVEGRWEDARSMRLIGRVKG